MICNLSVRVDLASGWSKNLDFVEVSYEKKRKDAHLKK